MPLLATITLRSPDDWSRVVDLVRQHAGALAAMGTPLRVMVARKLASRSMDQHRFMWADVLTAISRQACIRGRWFSAESWHEYLKAEFLPEVCSRGIEKWAYHADGTRSLQMSTTDLDRDEFDSYLLAIQSHAASEWGVVFTNRDEGV